MPYATSNRRRRLVSPRRQRRNLEHQRLSDDRELSCARNERASHGLGHTRRNLIRRLRRRRIGSEIAAVPAGKYPVVLRAPDGVICASWKNAGALYWRLYFPARRGGV